MSSHRSIRRVLALAVAVLLVASACEAFHPDELKYTVTIENDSPEGVPSDLTVTLITADGQQTFGSGPGDIETRWNYLGGHFSVTIRPRVEQQVSDLTTDRDKLEAELLSSADASSAADLESKVNALNVEIQAAYRSVSNSVSCTNNFPENRQAFVQISVIATLHIDCGAPTE